MRVLIADDQPEVRSALRLIIEQESEFVIAGDAASAALLLAQVHRTMPDVVLLDWELPGLPTCELLPALHDIQPKLRLIAMSGRPEARKDALAAGACAFISKGEPPERVLAALSAVREF